jgi:mono/diheme cytochrome c family protein
MSTRVPRILSALVLLPVLPHNAGGWAVVTVKDLPDHAVAGQPVALTWAVRQHGTHLVPGLRGRVVARSGAQEVSADATPTVVGGSYRAQLALPRAGTWTVTVHSGFMESRTAFPLRVVDAGSAATTALADVDRGRQLFLAKGCVTCHSHAGSGAPAEASLRVGPDLTDRRLPADYLAKFLADPSIKTVWASGNRMPDLELAPREIAALVTFLNADRRVSTR